jgi:uncharacterized protein YutE (UPF0331/DUF86 family)
MDNHTFVEIQKNLAKNIDEIKETLKRKNLLTSPDTTKTIERMKYLLYSITKTLIDIGHSIMLEKDLPPPRNRADIFICLAELEIIMSSIVPGVKKAVIAFPRMNTYTPEDTVRLIASSIGDLHACLDSFAAYFTVRDTAT